MPFEGFNPGTEQIKDIAENNNSDSLAGLKNEINSQIEDKSLNNEAKKELAEFVKKLRNNKDSIVNGSKLILDDLRQELQEDLNALNDLEDKFKDYPGYDVFKKIFLNEISDADKEIIYDLIESGEFQKFIDRRLKGQMFPDVEKLRDFLLRMKRRGKVEKKGQDSDIKEIFELEIDNLSIDELNYYKNKIDDLLKITSISNIGELKKIKIEIGKLYTKKLNKKELNLEEGIKKKEEGVKKEEEGVKKEEEGVKKEEEGVKKEEEGVKKDFDKKKKFNEILMSKKSVFIDVAEKALAENNFENKGVLQEKLNLLKNIDGVNELTDKIKDDLIKELLNGDNLKLIIKQAVKSKKYAEIRKFLVNLGDSVDNTGFIEKISSVEKELGIEPMSKSGVGFIRQREIENFVGKDSDYEVLGNKVVTDGKEVDFSEIPPKAYLVGVEGYKLETDMQKMEDTNEIIEKRRELQEIKLELKSLKKSLKRKNELIKEIEQTPEEKRTNKQKENLKKLKNEVKDIKEKIKNLIKDAEDLKKDFFDEMELFDYEEKQELKKKQEKQRETLNFIHLIGLDLIKQDFSNKLINNINFSGTLKKKFGFDKKIDLANGKLGINLDGKTDKNSLLEQQQFAKFVNLMISGDKKYPIDTKTMEHGVPVFKDENGKPIVDKKAYVNKNLQYGYSSLLENVGLIDKT